MAVQMATSAVAEEKGGIDEEMATLFPYSLLAMRQINLKEFFFKCVSLPSMTVNIQNGGKFM